MKIKYFLVQVCCDSTIFYGEDEIHVVNGVSEIRDLPGLSMEVVDGAFKFVPSYVIVVNIVVLKILTLFLLLLLSSMWLGTQMPTTSSMYLL